jgi:tetratricopeptide (TPR) repeat protein
MNSAGQEGPPHAHSVEPFEERIDILYRELELAIKWQRPSVLLVIFGSEYVHADAEAALEERLTTLGQTVHRLKVRDSRQPNVTQLLAKAGAPAERVFFVDSLRNGSDKASVEVYRSLNTSREFFVENRVRIVFWLTEREAIDLAHCAPDYWAFRHRVIEFVEPPRPEQLSSRSLQLSAQGIGQFSEALDDLDDRISLRTALLADLPAGDESTAPRADLQLTLGVLYWRRGDFDKAGEFLNDALRLTCVLKDPWSQALCLNALALVQTDLDRFEEAVETYLRAASLAPEQVPWNNLGKLYTRLGRHQEAIEVLQKAIQNSPRDAISWHGLGEIYCTLDRSQEAEAAFQKALELAPNQPFAWSGLGRVRVETGRPEEAIAAFQKALQLDARLAGAWLGLGRAFRLLRQGQNAVTAYKKALAIEPRNARAWSELADLHFEAEDYEQAAPAYRKAIDLWDGSPEGRGQAQARCCVNLADVCFEQEKFTDAILLYRKALEATGSPEEQAALWNLIGDCHRRANDYDQAIAAYRQADVLDPESAASREARLAPEAAAVEPAEDASTVPAGPLPEAAPQAAPLPEPETGPAPELALGSTASDFNAWLQDLGDLPQIPQEPSSPTSAGPEAEGSSTLPEEAPAAQEEPEPAGEAEAIAGQPSPAACLDTELPATRLEPDAPAPASELRSEGVQRGCDPTLEDTQPMRRARRSDPRNAQIWNELGNIYFNAGAEDDAIAAFQKAIELDPGYGWSYGNLATVFTHKGRYTEAVPLFRKGIDLLHNSRDQALLWNRLGDAYRRLNDSDNAALAYNNASELDPGSASLLTRARFSLLGNCKVP